jgi:hypothetical protein
VLKATTASSRLRSGALSLERDLEHFSAYSRREATTFSPLLGKVGNILPNFPTFHTLHFPTFGAAIIKSITFPAHVFLIETCPPFKERTQPWSQPWVERDLPSKNLSHFPTFPTEFPTFPTDFNAKYSSSGHTGCGRRMPMASPQCGVTSSCAGSDPYGWVDAWALPPAAFAVVEALCGTQSQSMAYPLQMTQIIPLVRSFAYCAW